MLKAMNETQLFEEFRFSTDVNSCFYERTQNLFSSMQNSFSFVKQVRQCLFTNTFSICSLLIWCRSTQNKPSSRIWDLRIGPSRRPLTLLMYYWKHANPHEVLYTCRWVCAVWMIYCLMVHFQEFVWRRSWRYENETRCPPAHGRNSDTLCANGRHSRVSTTLSCAGVQH